MGLAGKAGTQVTLESRPEATPEKIGGALSLVTLDVVVRSLAVSRADDEAGGR